MMNPISTFLMKRKIKKGGLSFNRDALLKAHPVRNSLIKWEESEKGEVSLVVPQKSTSWVKIVSKLFMLPRSRVVALDEVGSFVWTLCDGHNTIDNIMRALCNKYKLTRKEAQTSLFAFFRMLGKRGMIGFAVPKKKAATETEQEIESNLSVLSNQK